MAVRTDLRRFTIPMLAVFALAAGGTMALAQATTTLPLTSKWTHGAVPGGGGIAVSAYPVITGQPFTANNDSRSIEMVRGMKVTYESHSIVARDASGSVATRTTESSHVSLSGERNRSGAYIPAGGTISDPVAGVRIWWTSIGPPQLRKFAMKRRMVGGGRRLMHPPLTACEREAGQTRHLPSGVTQRIENLGTRRIGNLLAEGCRVTDFIPKGTAGSNTRMTTTEKRWISPKLRVILLYVFRGSNGVERKKQLDNVILGEPDPALFAPPLGYTIRDMDAEIERQEHAEFTAEPREPDAEMLAGAWEANDPFAPSPAQAGIFIHIWANRRVPFHHGTVTGRGPQKFQDMQIRVYERMGSKDKGGWFSTTVPNGGASWDGHHLRLAGPNIFGDGQLALDWIFNAHKDLWTGTYTRGGVTKQVQFVRPGALSKAVSNPFLGAWSESGRLGPSPPAPRIPRCVYIARGSDGTLVAWRDTLLGPTIGPSKGLLRAMFQENDGDALGVKIDGDTLMLQEGIYWGGIAGQPPQRFFGKLASDGMHIMGSWSGATLMPQDQNHTASHPVTTYTRMRGASCWPQVLNQSFLTPGAAGLTTAVLPSLGEGPRAGGGPRIQEGWRVVHPRC